MKPSFAAFLTPELLANTVLAIVKISLEIIRPWLQDQCDRTVSSKDYGKKIDEV
jgi:hypothetical protein